MNGLVRPPIRAEARWRKTRAVRVLYEYLNSQEPDGTSAKDGDVGGGSHLGDSGDRVNRHCEGFHLRGVTRASGLSGRAGTDESAFFQRQDLGHIVSL